LKIRCFAYAPPPVVDKVDAPGIKEAMIYTFVNERDIVPRVSCSSVLLLCKQVHAVDELDLDLQQRVSLITKQASAAKDHIDKIRTAVDGVRRTSCHHLPQQLIPGTIFWTPAHQTQKVWEVDARHMSELLMPHDFFSHFDDHRMAMYEANIDTVAEDQAGLYSGLGWKDVRAAFPLVGVKADAELRA